MFAEFWVCWQRLPWVSTRYDLYSPSSCDRSVRVVDFVATNCLLMRGVGDAAAAYVHAEENSIAAEGRFPDAAMVLREKSARLYHIR